MSKNGFTLTSQRVTPLSRMDVPERYGKPSGVFVFIFGNVEFVSGFDKRAGRV